MIEILPDTERIYNLCDMGETKMTMMQLPTNKELLDSAQKQVIEIKYFTDIDKLTYVDDKSDWIDLRASETVEMKEGDFKLVPLGVAMKLPKGYEGHVAPRSSTFNNYGVLQVNGIAIIDNIFNGDGDMWKLPLYATRDTVIHKNDRICQFRIIENQPKIRFVEVTKLEDTNRGGFGSTGVN